MGFEPSGLFLHGLYNLQLLILCSLPTGALTERFRLKTKGAISGSERRRRAEAMTAGVEIRESADGERSPGRYLKAICRALRNRPVLQSRNESSSQG